MKAGARALGVAESSRGDRSTIAGALVRASRVVDDLAFRTCTVGGTDATDAVCRLWDDLAREDVQYVLVAGIAPAWYNVLDLHAIAAHVDRPVLSVSFEASDGLEPAIREGFADDPDAREERLSTYRAQPQRRRLDVNGEEIFLRHVGIDAGEADAVIREFTPEGGRPEPLRVARLAARAADRFRQR